MGFDAGAEAALSDSEWDTYGDAIKLAIDLLAQNDEQFQKIVREKAQAILRAGSVAAPGGQPPAPGGQPPAPGGQPPAPGGQPPAPGGQPPR